MEYIERDGRKFTAAYDENGNIIKTAEETYADWAAGKNFESDAPQSKEAERITALEAQNAQLAEQLLAAKILLGVE